MAAWKHSNTIEKWKHLPENEVRRRLEIEYRFLSKDEEAIGLINDGYEQFRLDTVIRILTENPRQIIINNCPECQKLARTPYAKQCRNCGYNWHIPIGICRIQKSFQIQSRNIFVAIVNMEEGKFEAGNYLNLNPIWLSEKPKITAIECALIKNEGNSIEEPALVLSGLNDESKDFLIKNCPFDIVLDII